jgi:hypothetical protein
MAAYKQQHTYIYRAVIKVKCCNTITQQTLLSHSCGYKLLAASNTDNNTKHHCGLKQQQPAAAAAAALALTDPHKCHFVSVLGVHVCLQLEH